MCLGHCLLQLFLEQIAHPSTLHVAHGLRILALGRGYLSIKGVGKGLQPGGSVEFLRDTFFWYTTASLDHAITHADYEDGPIRAQLGGSLQRNLLHERGTGDVVQNEGVCVQRLLLQQRAHLYVHKFPENVEFRSGALYFNKLNLL